MTRKRQLSSTEKALWEKIARTVVPLRPETSVPAIEAATPTPEAEKPGKPPRVAAEAPQPQPKPKKVGPQVRPAADIDRKMRRKLARGVLSIDARIDLHGMTQEEAHGALIRFITSSAGMRRRVVLVITGKGMGEGEGRGVLRRNVPHWLASRDLARHVVTFGPAHAAHGGDGALYVRLRGPKT
ncbi:DNA mismatch repair protein MutS [Acuticoccus sediminis]|uniref:DNA mismatch repair protein MutS n=1 Tax=Acuticoccus sediminis TaxID=2184697 RepID=A0A8B2NT41_9HYPH|nr:Smr/MutS family protein [Acuticoccus sediminis]RAI03387.1 DNA mismatch repair protein MutS [Acuticoccus sediminis]